jgi:uncharacterized repeat protein (TIGR01451 family)
MKLNRKTRAPFTRRRSAEGRFHPQLLALEDRLAPANLTIELDPVIDQFGNQFEVIQIYRDESGDRQTFGIFDTGASPVTFSWVDQFFFTELLELPIPTIPGATVEAQGVGGTLSGAVSRPGTILADGLHALDIVAYFAGDPNALNLSTAAAVAGVQAMIGDPEGSPNLPAIVGTPIMNGRISGSTSDGVAVLVDQYGYDLDFGALFPGFGFDGLILQLPDLHFVAPGTNLADLPPVPDTHAPVRLPVQLFGIDNHLDPGNNLTESFNPVMATSFANGTTTLTDKTMLFDTGAQLSIISSEIALALGLDLQQPEFSIGVGGAGGQAGAAINVPGFIIDSLTLPLDDNNDGVLDGELILTGVPIFVLDLGFGLDGILGMNLFNLATHMLYDPFDPDGPGGGGPSVQLIFSTLQREPIDLEEFGDALALLQASGLPLASVGNLTIPSFDINNAPTVAANQPSVVVNEGQSATNTGTFGDIDGDTVQLSADIGTIVKTGPDTWSWSVATTDGNAGPFLVTITADDGRGGVKTTSFGYTVNNVAPTISLSGAAAVDVDTAYELELGAVVDPGQDTMTSYVVHWGDGASDSFNGSPAGKTHQHAYTAGGVQRTITVDLVDEDGTHAAAGSKTITVNAFVNTVPTVAADNASVSATEGQSAANTGTFADSDGHTVVISASVGSVIQNGTSNGTWTWTLLVPDGPLGPVQVTITADDGNGGVQTATFTYSVTNIAPTVALSGAVEVDKQSIYELEFGAVVDPGADTVTAYEVHWGDGTSTGVISGAPTGTLQHVYTVGGVQRTITVDLIDEDGTHTTAGTKDLFVREVTPDLWIKQQAKPARVVRGGLLTFTITVVNRGSIAASGVYVDYTLPASLSFVRKGSTPAWQKVNQRKFKRILGDLEAGQSVKLVFKARAASNLRSGMKLTTTALVRDDGLGGLDPNLADNRSKIVTRVR